MEEQPQRFDQQSTGHQKSQESNNIKKSGIAIAALLALIVGYVFLQKKEPEPSVSVVESPLDEGTSEEMAEMMEPEHGATSNIASDDTY